MSTVIDNQVVSMQFDNHQFESGVRTSLSTLEKLKQSLNLTGATKGLETLSDTASRFDMNPIAQGVQAVHAKFSALEVMGITALTNITNTAVNAGKRIVKALTIDPIKTGFQEYELKMGSVQTIMASTGAKLSTVNKYLEELNLYADKTIYSFSDMTNNIGKFTNAGVKLDDAVMAIKGISNEAAVSGANANEASRAMYNFAQALSAGYVKLIDWKSIENANMATVEFKNHLLKAAEAAGTVKKNTNGMYKVLTKNAQGKTMKDAMSATKMFNESLAYQWMTTEVLVNTLKEYADETTDIGKKAYAAAQDVKTFTQLFDTLKEAAQSGWSQTWELFIGDFNEAKALLTDISNRIGGILDASSNARNELLSGALQTGWKQLLGKGIIDESGFTKVVKSVAKKHKIALDKMITDEVSFTDTLKEGWMTTNILTESVSKYVAKIEKMSKAKRKAKGYDKEHLETLKALEKGFEDGSISVDDFVKKINRSSGRELIIDTIKTAFEDVMSIIDMAKEQFREIFPATTSEQVYSIIKSINEFVKSLKLSETQIIDLKATFKGVFSIAHMCKTAFEAVVNAIKPIFGYTDDAVGGILSITGSIGEYFANLDKEFTADGITKVLSIIVDDLSLFLDTITGKMEGFGDTLSSVGQWLLNVFNGIWDRIKEVLDWISNNISFGDIVAGAVGGSAMVSIGKITNLIDAINEAFDKLTNKTKAYNIKQQFSDVLNSVKESIQAFTTGIRVGALVQIAIAMGILAVSLTQLSKLKALNVAQSVLVVGTTLAILMKVLKTMTKTLSGFKEKGGLISAAFSLILIAEAIKILSDAMVTLSTLNIRKIGRALAGVGGGLAILVGSIKLIGKTKTSVTTAMSMILIAKSCEILGEALQSFAKLSWDQICYGLTAMGGALSELTGSVILLGKFGGASSLAGSIGLYIAVQSLSGIVEALTQFSNMSWDQIWRGLTGMGLALSELAVVTGLLGKFAGFSGLIGATSILIVTKCLDDIADSLFKFSMFSWSEIWRGLTGMGLALSELAIVTGLLGKIAGFSGLVGATSILIITKSLDEITIALSSIGSLKWDQIWRGLTGMGLALSELAIVTGLLGKLGGLGSLLGAGTILLGAQGLSDLADALKKFGDMSWDEIDRGLTAMETALGEIAIGGLANTLSGFGAMAISEVAKPLGDLADSVKKWNDVTIPENLGTQLANLGNGIFAFTFDGMGANAISTVSEPLGVMADSIKKWKDVTIPEELASNMRSLAHAVRQFIFTGLGSNNIDTVAEPLGVMADSIKKWKDVTIPEGFDTELKSLSDGIKSFSFTAMGGWSLNAIIDPLGLLVDSINKWKDVTIPDKIDEKLKTLADGIKSFSWAFSAGWALDAIVPSFGKLAEGISIISKAELSEEMGEKLKTFGDDLSYFIETIKPIFKSDVSKLNTLAINIDKLNTNVNKISVSNVKNIETFIDIVNKLSSLKIDMKTITKSVNSLIDTLNSKVEKKKTETETAFKILIKCALTGINSNYDSFVSTGRYLGEGLINGINEKKKSAYDAGYELGKKSALGVKEGAKVNSPSKLTIPVGKSLGEGIIVGIDRIKSTVFKHSSKFGTNTANSISEAVSRASDLFGSYIDSDPTIRPVVDLTDIRNSAKTINSLFANRQAVSLGANIDARAINQNGNPYSATSVVNAIKDLQSNVAKLQNVKGGNTYIVNGVTYDDGTNISTAVEDLVHAVVVGGRS